jgi:DNA-binding NarL/FixJ family response regulator
MSARTRITLCDDHPVVLAGLRHLIAMESGFELVGEAINGLDALRMIREVRPDVAVLDISMPQMNGIVAVRRLAVACPEVRLMILTLHEDRAYLKQAIAAGARGYALKRSAAEQLVHAIRAVMVGGLYVDPALADRMFDSHPKRNASTPTPFATPEITEREAEVLKLAALGFTNKEAARKLDIGVKSIETYRARGLEKLSLGSRTQLVRYAAAQGWLADA